MCTPKGAPWDQALAAWRQLRSDDDAVFDREIVLHADEVAPQVTFGTSPGQVMAIDTRIPDAGAGDAKALAYMALDADTPIVGVPIDHAFIGSCTNGRIEDLRAAAAIVRDRHVAASVRALVVPGSQAVKRQAEREGLDRIFTDAGFEWREPGCSLCVAMNDDRLPAGARCASTSNRNFEGRQGAGARTHLMSPAMVAAAAIAGRIVDVRGDLA